MKTLLLTATLLAASPAFAGGPVVVEDAMTQEARPSSEGRWVIPVVATLVVVCLIACGGGNDAPVTKPADPCNGGC